MLKYSIGNSGQSLIITDKVLKHFNRHRQCRADQPEAGGQLFAKFDGAEVIIQEATGPRPRDRRGRTYYHPDRQVEQIEIEQMYKKNLHFIGDWHTHAAALPKPSSADFHSIKETFQRSLHQLNGFILIVLGTEKGTRGIRVSITDGRYDYELQGTSVGKL